MSVYAYAKPSSRFSYSNGGAICLTRSFCNLTFCEFSNNTVTGDASKYSNLGYGGGIYANISSNVIVNSCQFNHKFLRNVGPSLDYASTMSGDASGLNNVIFNDAFEKACILPTNQFSFSDQFSISEIFTRSEASTETSVFSESNKFSFSDQFSNSELFTKSNLFSSSHKFTKSNLFASIQHFTASNWFTKTSFFSNSIIFSISYHFSDSSIFSCLEKYLFSSIQTLTKPEILSI